MDRVPGRSELEMLRASLASRQAVAREAYEAYDFGIRVECGPSSGFFFATHEGEAVMARRIVIFPEPDAPAKAGWFCVAFEAGTTTMRHAFAYTAGNAYYGSLPDDFVPGCSEEAVDPEPSYRFM